VSSLIRRGVPWVTVKPGRRVGRGVLTVAVAGCLVVAVAASAAESAQAASGSTRSSFLSKFGKNRSSYAKVPAGVLDRSPKFDVESTARYRGDQWGTWGDIAHTVQVAAGQPVLVSNGNTRSNRRWILVQHGTEVRVLDPSGHWNEIHNAGSEAEWENLAHKHRWKPKLLVTRDPKAMAERFRGQLRPGGVETAVLLARTLPLESYGSLQLLPQPHAGQVWFTRKDADTVTVSIWWPDPHASSPYKVLPDLDIKTHDDAAWRSLPKRFPPGSYTKIRIF